MEQILEFKPYIIKTLRDRGSWYSPQERKGWWNLEEDTQQILYLCCENWKSFNEKEDNLFSFIKLQVKSFLYNKAMERKKRRGIREVSLDAVTSDDYNLPDQLIEDGYLELTPPELSVFCDDVIYLGGEDIRSKMLGETTKEMAKRQGVTRQAVEQKLKGAKSSIQNAM